MMRRGGGVGEEAEGSAPSEEGKWASGESEERGARNAGRDGKDWRLD